MEDDKLDKISTSSISTASTDISTEQKNNNKVSIDKLLNKKQQDQRTEKKQTPLEKYLADYEKTLENKSPEDLEKERNELEQQQKMSLIASIILAILALALLITACIFLPLAPALVIAIPAAIGAITAVASGIIEYNIANKKIDIVNAKKSDLSWRKTTQHIGNNKSRINNLGAGIQQNNSNDKIKTAEKNIVNNNSAGKENKNIANNINNNILKNQGNKNNINIPNNNTSKNNTQSIPNNNISKNTKQNNTNVISNNVTANAKNNTNSNNIKNDNGNVNDKKINTNAPIKINIKNTLNNNSNHSATQARDIKDDNEAADLIYKQTQEQVLNGTLDLYNNRPKNEEEYKKCRDAAKNAKTQTERAKNQQQMIKYEIWSQLTQTSQQMYDQRIEKGKTPEKILEENIPNENKNWQVELYHQHLENENKSFFSYLNPFNLFKTEPTIQDKRKVVQTEILKGSQQKNGIKLSDVGKTAGTNYNSGAIKSEDKKLTLIKIN